MPKTTQNQPFNHNPAEKKQLQDFLLTGGRINKAEFIKLTGNPFSALAQRVYDLKQEGFDIIPIKIKKQTKGYYCYYKLSDGFLNNVAVYGLDNTLRGELLAKEIA